MFKKNFTHNFSDWLWLSLVIFMLANLPILASWLAERYQVTAVDLVLPVLLSFLTSLIIGAIFFKSFKKNKFATLVGAIGALLVLGQGYENRLAKVLPIFSAFSPFTNLKQGEGIFYSLVFILTILGLAFLVIRLINNYSAKRKWNLVTFAKAITIVIGVAFSLQLFSILRVIVIEWRQFSFRPPALNLGLANKNPATEKPDIYYLVLDRYTNEEVLKSQFNTDNADFLNFLKENNFVVNAEAYSNYPFTTMSIASTLNADYNRNLVNKFGKSRYQILEPYHDSIRYSAVIQELKSLGYNYYQLGNWYEASNQAPLADKNYQNEGQFTLFNHQITLNPFSKNILGQSIYWQFLKSGLKIGHWKILTYSSMNEKETILYQLSKLKEIAKDSSGNRFIFAHLLIPHDPYYFNADGSLSTQTGNDNVGRPIKEKYLGQVSFINNQVKELFGEIKKASAGKAVILLQADEGPYPMFLNGESFDSKAVGDELDGGDMTKWTTEDLKMKYGILAAYDIPAAKKEDFQAAGNSVNIFRLIFNSYFNANLSYLPQCFYAFTDGRKQAFVYQEISDRLVGHTDPKCSVNDGL